MIEVLVFGEIFQFSFISKTNKTNFILKKKICRYMFDKIYISTDAQNII
jgi:hypothetical protein